MTVYALDARTATRRFPGIGRYVHNLARGLTGALEAEERVIVLHGHPPPRGLLAAESAGHRIEWAPEPSSPFSLRQQWRIPRLLGDRGVDLYHSPYYLMPYRPGVSTVLTVYDLIPLRFPQHVSVQARWLFRATSALALRAADHVLTISETTRQDLIERLGVDGARATTVHLAAEDHFRPQSLREVERVQEQYALPGSYVLYFGINKPHKNLLRLVESWAALRERRALAGATLVIAGAWDPRYPDPKHRAESLGLEEAIRFLGPIPEADLPALYAGATLFVFPSLYEGFGLPVIEAMACGTPVACARTDSLVEVAGEAALLFDPTSVTAIAEALERALDDPDLRAALRSRGLERVSEFSWQRTGEATLSVYRSVMQK